MTFSVSLTTKVGAFNPTIRSNEIHFSQVIAVEDGEQAIDLLTKDEYFFDLVLLDIRMPKMVISGKNQH